MECRPWESPSDWGEDVETFSDDIVGSMHDRIVQEGQDRQMARKVSDCLFTVTGARLVEAGTVERPVAMEYLGVPSPLDRSRMRTGMIFPRPIK
jgi:hypothetical protein